MADVFLSYSHRDRRWVEKLASALSATWQVWWDDHIKPANHFDREIDAQLRQCSCVVVLWSRFSVESDWVLEEAFEGKRRQILIPVRIDSTELPFGYRRIETIDLSSWEGNEGRDYEALCDAISLHIDKPSKSLQDPHPEGRYRITSLLSETKNLRVDLAWDLRLEKDVTIAQFAFDTEAADDARALVHASNHQQLTRVHDFRSADSVLYIVADYLGSKTLTPDSSASLFVKLQLFDEVCEAIEHLHKFGLAHGNIRPQSIATDITDAAVVGGLLPWNVQHHLSYDDGYIAPELRLPGLDVRGVELSARQSADFYALGVLLVHLITGDLPSVSSKELELPADSGDEVLSLCRDLIAPDPESRLDSFPIIRKRLATAISYPLQSGQEVNSHQTPSVDVFFGRESIIAQAHQQFRDVLTGQPGILLIQGIPGVGKSRTFEMLEDIYLRDGANVLKATAIEGLSLPFAPIAELLRRRADLLGDAGSSLQQWARGDADAFDARGDHQQLLLNGMAALLARSAERSPTVFMLDDFHWSDRATRDLILTVAASISNRKDLSLLLVVSSRPDAGNNDLEQLARARTTMVIDLQPLTLDACAALTREVVTLPPSNQLIIAIFEMSRGNPLFVKELCRHLQSIELIEEKNGYLFVKEEAFRAQVPPGIKKLLAARVEILPLNIRDFLSIQSCFSDKVSLKELVLVAESTELDTIEMLEVGLDAAILEHLPGQFFQFTHPLFRQVIYTSISSLKRQTLHAKIAQALIEHQPENVVTIADHLIRAESFADIDLLAAYAARAADELRERYAWRDAVRFYEVCLSSHLESAYSASERASLHHSAGIVSGKFDTGADRSRWHYAEALDLYEKTNDIVGQANALREILRWQFLFRERRENIDQSIFERLQMLLPMVEAESESLYGATLETMATHLVIHNQVKEAAKLTQEAAHLAERLGDHELKANLTESSFLSHLARMEVVEARNALQEGLHAAQARNHWYWETQWSIRLPMTHFALGELSECQTAIRRTHKLDKDVPITDHVLSLSVELSLCTMRGEFESALQIGEEVIERLRLSSYFWPAPSAILTLCQIHSYRGDFDGAHRQLELLRSPGVINEPRTYEAFTARTELLINRYQSGALLQTAEEGGHSTNRPNDFNLLPSLSVRAQLADRSSRLAAEDVIDSLRNAKANGVVVVQGWNALVDRLIAMNLFALGEFEDAIQHINEATKFAEQNELRAEQNLCMLISLTIARRSVHDENVKVLERDTQSSFAALDMYFPKTGM